MSLRDVERESIVTSSTPAKSETKAIRSIFVVLVLCAVSTQTLSQKLTTRVELPKSKWLLEEVLTYLSQHYHVQFSYVRENINATSPIIIAAKSIPLNDLIIEISEQADLEFRLLSNQVVLRKKRILSPEARSEVILVDIEGTVTDSLTHLPLPHANVYLNHTTFGTATDENGTFLLKNIPVGKYEFISSYVGYKTMIYSLMIKPDRHLKLEVKLLPTANELKSVTITPKRDKVWLKQFNLFRRELLGNTTNSRLCTIINPEDVNITETQNLLSAETKEPLEIENRALGYRIYVTLKKFVVGSEDYYLEFNSHFEELQPANDAEELRWELNRLNSYGGSEMHLFRSMLDHRSWPEGFSIYKQNTSPVLAIYEGDLVAASNYSIPFNDKVVAFDSGEDNLAVVFEKGRYLITYDKKILSQNQQTVKGATYATSFIEVNSPTLKVDSRGLPILPHDYTREGFINTHRIADKLPSDYDPERSRKKIYSYRLDKPAFIEGFVVDSATKEPVPGADVFINFSTSHTKTNGDGKFRLNEIGLGENDVVISKFNYITKHYKIITDSMRRQADTLVLSDKPFHHTAEQLNQLPNSVKGLARESEISKFKRYLHSSQELLNEQLLTVRIDELNKSYYDSYFPLEVIDNKLGYRMNIFLENDHVLDRVASKETLPPKASCYYETIDTSIKNHYKEIKRLEEYEGSPLHFLRSLLYGRSIEEGFYIYKPNSSASLHSKHPFSEKEREEVFPANLVYTETGYGTTVELPEWIEVHYSLPTAGTTRIFRLHVPLKRILFCANGYVSDNFAEVIFDSGTTGKKLVPRLPVDYTPPKEAPLNSF